MMYVSILLLVSRKKCDRLNVDSQSWIFVIAYRRHPSGPVVNLVADSSIEIGKILSLLDKGYLKRKVAVRRTHILYED